MTTAAASTYWNDLDPRYRVILCDIWGVVHDGLRLSPNAAERLAQWRGQGRTVILVTNAPRPADSVAVQLDRIGLPRECWNGISTSGEAGIAALIKLGELPGFVGTAEDRALLEAHGLRFADATYHALAVTGLFEDRMDPEAYTADIAHWRAADIVMHCLNPDRIVHHAGTIEACAGALGDAYEAAGGHVEWYGKPHATIYHHALGLAGDPPPHTVLAIGDSLRTDMLGAARSGFDAVFVQSGIHAGESWPSDFAAANGLGNWHPIAIVDGLA